MLIINCDIILVIGGKKQVLCEKYSITLSKWREMPLLPEERYLGNVLFNEKDFHLYLFGGKTDNMINDSILILNLKSVGGWDKVFLKENSKLLKRFNSISFHFIETDNDNIYICGGETDDGEETDFIVEYNYKTNKAKKTSIESKNNPSFNISTVIDRNRNLFSFVDSDENIYILKKDYFTINIFNQEDS